MKKIILLILFSGWLHHVYPQEVQWASTVIGYSTQLSDYEYSARQILGKPDVLPGGGDHPNAWMPSRPDRISEIKVGFGKPVKIQQVAIAESFNPGALYQVYLYDPQDKEYLLSTFNPHPVKTLSRLMNIYIPETPYEVAAIRIVLDGEAVPGYNAIDAIGISSQKDPIEAMANLAFRKNPNRESNTITYDGASGLSEWRPVVSNAEDRLYFTRRFFTGNLGGNGDVEDIWYYSNTNNSWKDPVNLGAIFNNSGPNIIADISALEGVPVMLLGNASGKSGKLQNGLFMSEWINGEWSPARELKIKNAYIGSWDADYFLTRDGKYLLISTDRYDTEGGKDIYLSRYEEKGKFSEPVNLGELINTAYDDRSPFFDASENVLYFSSGGFNSFGKTDIFRTIRLDESWKNWTEPENLGADINTPNNELFFILQENQPYAFFSRDDQDSLFSIIRIEKPLFMIPTPLVTLKGTLKEKMTGGPVAGEVLFSLLPEKIEYGYTTANPGDGNYEIHLPSGNRYQVTVHANGYKHLELQIVLENQNRAYGYTLPLEVEMLPVLTSASEPVDKDKEKTEEPEKVLTTPISGQKPVVQVTRTEKRMDYDLKDIHEVLFPFNSATPIDESLPVIETIASFLKNNPDIKVEIAGFTDYIGDEKTNYDLSVLRALTVKNILIEKQVSSRRIRVIGFGEKMPTSMESSGQLMLNRRVEFNFTR